MYTSMSRQSIAYLGKLWIVCWLVSSTLLFISLIQNGFLTFEAAKLKFKQNNQLVWRLEAWWRVSLKIAWNNNRSNDVIWQMYENMRKNKFTSAFWFVSFCARNAPFIQSLRSKSASENFEKSIEHNWFSSFRFFRSIQQQKINLWRGSQFLFFKETRKTLFMFKLCTNIVSMSMYNCWFDLDLQQSTSLREFFEGLAKYSAR